MTQRKNYCLILIIGVIGFLISSFISMALELTKPITVWEGTIEVVDEVKVPPRLSLTIKPKTKVIFKGKGSMLIKGKLQAEAAVFVAENVLDKCSRIKSENGTIVFKGCHFKDIISTHVKYQNPGIQLVYGWTAMHDCLFENCSAIDIVLVNGAIFAKNFVSNPVSGYGLVLRHCRETLVKENLFLDNKRQRRTKLLMIAGKRAMSNQVIANRFFGGTSAIESAQSAKGNIIKRNLFVDVKNSIVFQSQSADNAVIRNAITGGSCGIVFNDSGTSNFVQNCVIWNAKKSSISVASPLSATDTRPVVTIRDSVLAGSNEGLSLSSNSGTVILEHNLFWHNKQNFVKDNPQIRHQANINADPMFVDEENGNFRPKMKRFGHDVNSPLLGAGSAKDSNIGIYPVLEMYIGESGD